MRPDATIKLLSTWMPGGGSGGLVIADLAWRGGSGGRGTTSKSFSDDMAGAWLPFYFSEDG